MQIIKSPLILARLWMAAAVGSALLCHVVQVIDWPVLLGLGNCIMFVMWQLRSLKLKPIPSTQLLPLSLWQKMLPSAFAGMCIANVAWQYQTLFGRDMGIASLTILTTFKLWEYRSARDAQIMAGLLFFLLLSVFLKQESALALAVVMVSAILTLSAWVFFNAYIDSNHNHNHNQIKVIQSQVKNQTHTQPDWYMPLRETLRLSLYGLPLAIILFFVFPRIAGPLWGLPSDSNSAQLGLSNTLESGRFAKLAGSDALALRVKFDDKTPTAQQVAQLYWRGPVLNQFDGLVWRAMPWRDDQAIKLNAKFIAEIEAEKALIHYQLIAEPHKQTLRVLLDTPLYAGPTLKFDSQLSPSGEPLLERETVHAISDPQLRWGTETNYHDMVYELQLPIGTNPRSVAYAKQLRKNIMATLPARSLVNDPTPYVQAVLKYYQNNNFKYSLEPPTPAGRREDAIDGFLMDTREGYCEHFATSFVVLMRAMGFPARIVTGYQGGELNPQDGWIVVPQNAAHAWAEVLHPTQGWLRIDPTAVAAPWRSQLGGNQLHSTAGKPPEGVQGLLKTSRDALLPLQQWAQATVRIWQDYGLNYGKNSQKTLFQTLGFDDINIRAIVSVLGAGIGVWTLMMLWLHRQRAVRRSLHSQALVQFDKRCAQLKLFRNPSQTPAAWLVQHGKSLTPQQLSVLQTWIQSYEITHFKR